MDTWLRLLSMLNVEGHRLMAKIVFLSFFLLLYLKCKVVLSVGMGYKI